MPDTWEALEHDCKNCRECSLWETRTNVVFGVGNQNAEVLFIGEGPGANEDAQGVPFVGRAGHLLDDMLEIIGLKRDDVYIANIVKCRPPENRDPLASACAARPMFLMTSCVTSARVIEAALSSAKAVTERLSARTSARIRDVAFRDNLFIQILLRSILGGTRMPLYRHDNEAK